MKNSVTYVSDRELTELYNSLEKGSLVRLLIEKHRQLEKQVKNLPIPVVSGCTCPVSSTDVYDSEQNYLGCVCTGCGYVSKY